jgi:hypothetical protein
MSETRLITPTCRLSFPYLFRPAKPMTDGGEEKYQCELIFDEGQDLSALKAAANKAAGDKWGDNIPKNIRTPFRKGSERDSEGYPDDCTFIGARSKDKPGVVLGANREACVDQSEVYGGCYVKVSVTAFAYDTSGNKGVSFALNNVWKIKDGEPFGNRRSAEDEFSDEQVDAEAFGDTVDSLL